MFVGGEFYYDDQWVLNSPSVDTQGMYFLNGGKACLILICKYLTAKGIDRLLLPSYLCPTILSTLIKCGMKLEFYRVKKDLSIDLEDLGNKAQTHQVVYFINYFGFRHIPDVQNLLKKLQASGILLVEDNAHSGFWENHLGDFTFNSMRKLCPYDGGYLATRFDLEPLISREPKSQNRRLPLIRTYRQNLGDYLQLGKGDHDELTLLYQLAEQVYETDMNILGDKEERRAIEHLVWVGIRQARRGNYLYLLDMLRDIRGITPVFPDLPEEVQPMGLPIYVDARLRDRLFNGLGDAGIGTTIHWDALLRDASVGLDATVLDIASSMLTLPIDQRTSHKQMDYMFEYLKTYIKYGKARDEVQY